MKMCSNKINKYYIAYCFNTIEGLPGFGDMVISNNNKLKMDTIEDIDNVKSFVKTKAKEIKGDNIENLTIMDWRELKNE